MTMEQTSPSRPRQAPRPTAGGVDRVAAVEALLDKRAAAAGDGVALRRLVDAAVDGAGRLVGRPGLVGGLSVLGASLLGGGTAVALPDLATVNSGDLTATRASPDTLHLNQGSSHADATFHGFDIDAGETVNVFQPSARSTLTARVSPGASATTITGALNANGHVSIINGSGVIFTKGAKIDVGSIVATTATTAAIDPTSGVMTFDDAAAGSSVINKGDITVRDGGFAALVAPTVRNDGTIHARLGKVTLASAQSFTVDPYGDRLVSFEIGATETAGRVDQSGAIHADGGVIMLDAGGLDRMVDGVLNLDGMARARSVGVENGEIVLGGETVTVAGRVDVAGVGAGEAGGRVTVTGGTASLTDGAVIDASGDAGGGTVSFGGSDGALARLDISDTATVRAVGTGGMADGGVIEARATGSLEIAGDLDVSGGDDGGGIVLRSGGDTVGSGGSSIFLGSARLHGDSGTGGRFSLLGDMVRLDAGAAVSATGGGGGGNVQIGGGYRGGDGVRTARTTVVDETAAIDVSATRAGDGGTIIVWSDEVTTVDGDLTARGAGGDGGLIETSGKKLLKMTRVRVDAGADDGAVGSWLIDPTLIRVQSGSGSATLSDVDSSTDPDTGAGESVINVALIDAATATVTLAATSGIIFETAVNMTTNGVGLTAVVDNGYIQVDAGATITTNDGDVTFTANGGQITIGAAIDTNGGALDLTATGAINQNANIDTNNGTATLRAGGAITQAAGTSIDAGTGRITLTAAGDITLGLLTTRAAGRAAGTAAGAAVTVTSTSGGIIDGDAGGGADIAATGGTVSLSAATGIGAANSLEIGAATLTGSNSRRGAIAVELAQSTIIDGLTQDATGGSDGIALSVAAGSGAAIDIQGSGITAAGTDDVTIDAAGEIRVHAAIAHSGAGGLSLGATDGSNIVISAALSAGGLIDIGQGASGTTTLNGLGIGTPLIDAGNQLILHQNTALATGIVQLNAGTGGIMVKGTVDGPQALVADSGTGTIDFDQAVGGTTRLAELTATAGRIRSGGGVINTDGAQRYDGDVRFRGDMSLSSNDNRIEFTGTLDADQDVTIDAGSGALTMTGDVGSGTALDSLDITATTTTVGGSVTTTGLQRYSDAVVLKGGTLRSTGGATLDFGGVVTLRSAASTINSSGGDITFASTIDGGQGLTVDAGTGRADFQAAVGGTTAIASLDVSAGQIDAGRVTTTGAQTYTGPLALTNGILWANGAAITFNDSVTLTGAATIDTTGGGASATGGDITFANTGTALNGNDEDLTLNAGTAGDVSIAGALGTPTGILTVAKAHDVTFNQDITAERLVVTDATGTVTAEAITTTGTGMGVDLTAAGFGFNDAITTNGQSTRITATGAADIRFGAAADISHGGGSAAIDITAAAGITMADGAEFDSGTGTITLTARNGNIALGRVTTGNASATAVTLNAVNGGITDAGDTGGADVDTGGGGLVVNTQDGFGRVANPIETVIGRLVVANVDGGGTASGDIAVSNRGHALTVGSLTQNATNGNVALDTSSAHDITLASAITTSGTGAITVNSGAAVSVTGALRSAGGAIAITGATMVDISAAIGSTTGDITLTATGGDLTLDDTLTNGSGDITARANDIAVNAAVRGGGNIDLAATNNLSVDATITSTSGNNTDTVTLSAVDTLAINENLQSADASIDLTGSTALVFDANITATGAGDITVNSAVTLGGASVVTTTAGDITIADTVDGAQAFDVASGRGTATFQGTVGGTTSLASLTTSGKADFGANNVTTSGNQRHRGRTIFSGGTVTSTGGAHRFDATMTLGGATTTTLMAASGVTFGAAANITGTTAYAESLSVDGGTGAVSFGAAVGSPVPLAGLDATTSGAGAITLTGADVGALDLSTQNGDITVGGMVNIDGPGPALITATGSGMVTMTGTVHSNADLTVTTNNQKINQSGAVTVAAGATYELDSSGGDITIGGAVDGPGSLKVDAGSGDMTMTGDVGSGTALDSLDITATTTTVGGSVTTTGLQRYSDAVVLKGGTLRSTGGATLDFGGAVTLRSAASTINSSGGDITFASTIDGGQGLTVDAGTGRADFQAAVGGTTAIASLDVSAGQIDAGRVTTTGAQTYTGPLALTNGILWANGAAITFNDNVTLTGAATIDTTGGGASATGGDITFANTGTALNGNDEDLTLNAGTAGDVSIAGALGTPTGILTVAKAHDVTFNQDITAERLVVTDATGTVTAEAITTTGTGMGVDLTAAGFGFNGAITTNGQSTRITATGAADIRFGAAADISHGGGSAAIDITAAAGITMADGAEFDSGTGRITLTAAGDITLGLLTTRAAGTAVTVTSTSGGIIDGDAGGGADIAATGGTVSLSAATGIGAANSLEIGAATLTGSNSRRGAIAVELAQSTIIDGLTQDATGGSDGIALSVAAGSGAAIDIQGSGITAAGTDDVTIDAAGEIRVHAAIAHSGAGGLSLGATDGSNIVISAALSAGGLIDIGQGASGTTTLNGLGIGTPLIDAGNQLILHQNTALATGIVQLNAGTGGIMVKGTVDGPQALVADSGTGTIDFDQAVGGTTRLAELTATAGRIRSGGGVINTDGAQRYDGDVRFRGDMSLSSNDNRIEFTGTLDADQDVTIDAGSGALTMTGDVGSGTALDSLDITATTTTVGGSVTTTGLQRYSDAVVLKGGTLRSTGGATLDFGGAVTLRSAASTINSSGGDITFASTIDGGQGLTVDAGTGRADFQAAVGGTTAIASLDVSAGQIDAGRVTTTGAQTYTGPLALTNGILWANGAAITFNDSVTLTGAATIDTTGGGASATGGDITFANTGTALNGNDEDLTLNAGTAGDVSIAGALGTPTGILTVAKAHDVTFNQDITAERLVVTDATGTVTAEAITTTGTGMGVDLTAAGFGFNGAITTNGQSTRITATGAADIRFGAAADISHGGGAAAIDITAAAGITMADGAEFDSGTGRITLTARNGNIALGRVTTGNASATAVTLNAVNGGITDAGDTGGADVDTGGGGLVVNTQDGFGRVANPIETVIGRLVVANVDGGGTASGDIAVSNRGHALTVGSLTQNATNGNVALDTSSAHDITLASAITTSGTGAITVNSGAAVSVTGALRSAGGAIAITGATMVDISAAIGSTTGDITLTATGGDLTLDDTLTNGSGDITARANDIAVNAAVRGGGNIDLAATNNLSVDATITSTSGNNTDTVTLSAVDTLAINENLQSADASIDLTGSTALVFDANITATGAGDITVNSAVTLGGASVVTTTAGDITIADTVDGAQAFDVASGRGTATFQGTVGGTTSLASLMTSGKADFGANNVTTSGNQRHRGRTIFSGGTVTSTGGAHRFDATMTLGGATTTTLMAASGVTFGAAANITGTTAYAESLSVDGGTGAVSFGAAVGSPVPLAGLDATTSGAGAITLTGADVGALDLSTQNGDITVGGMVNIDGPGPALITATGSGMVTMTGTVHSNADLTVTTNNQKINQSGAVTVAAGATYELDSSGGDITIGGAVDGPGSLKVDAGSGDMMARGVALGGTTKLATVDLSGRIITVNSVLTTGAQDYTIDPLNGHLKVVGAANFIGGPITINGPTLVDTDILTLNPTSHVNLDGGLITLSDTFDVVIYNPAGNDVDVNIGGAGVGSALLPFGNLLIDGVDNINIAGNVYVEGTMQLRATFAADSSINITSSVTVNGNPAEIASVAGRPEYDPLYTALLYAGKPGTSTPAGQVNGRAGSLNVKGDTLLAGRLDVHNVNLNGNLEVGGVSGAVFGMIKGINTKAAAQLVTTLPGVDQSRILINGCPVTTTCGLSVPTSIVNLLSAAVSYPVARTDLFNVMKYEELDFFDGAENERSGVYSNTGNVELW